MIDAESFAKATWGVLTQDVNAPVQNAVLCPLLCGIHRALFSNTTLEQSASAIAPFLGVGEVLSTSSSTFDWYLRFLEEVAFRDWVKVPRGQEKTFFPDLYQCVVNDEAKPPTLLPAAETLTAKFAVPTKTSFTDYVVLKKYPEHPPVFDVMWDHLTHGKSTSIYQETFLSWFSWAYFAWFTNATERRAGIAGVSHWFEAIASTGTFDFQVFLSTATHLTRFYLRSETPALVYEQLVELTAACAPNSTDFYSRRVRWEKATELNSATKFHILDELEDDKQERQYFAAPNPNRILVVGTAGVGKSTLGEALAKELNAVHLDVFKLALAASEDLEDPLRPQVEQDVASGKLARPTQIALLKRAMRLDSCLHCGYVLDDLPNCTSPDELDGFLHALEVTQIPQALVRIKCPSDAYDFWLQKSNLEKRNVLEAEEVLRQQEAAVAAKKELDAQKKLDRQRRQDARLERKAKIDAGEIQPGPEDEQEPEPEPEEEEASPEVDADGNPLEGEALLAARAVKEVAVNRRRNRADLFRAYMADRWHLEPDTPQVDFAEVDVAQPWLEVIQHRDRVATVMCYDATAVQTSFVISQLKLNRRSSPELPPVPAEQLEGTEGAEGEAALADLRQKSLQEDVPTPLSVWQRYCPVTWSEDRVLLEGSWLYSCSYRGKAYLLASKQKLEAFTASPHRYLLGDVFGYRTVAVFQEKLDTYTPLGFSAEELLQRVAVALQQTPLPIEEFHGSWKLHADEVQRKQAVQANRTEVDGKLVAAREERRRKLREAEAKKKKAADKVKKKKGEEEKQDEAEQLDPALKDDEAKLEDTAPQTIAAKLATELEKLKAAREVQVPLLVDCRGAEEDLYSTLLSQKVFPENIIVLQAKPPLREGEEEAEEEPQDEEDLGAPQDDEGEPAAQKKVKRVDLSDPKQYARAIRRILDGLQRATEDAANSDSTPMQTFSIKRINVYGQPLDDAVKTVVQAVHPCIPLAQPLPEGEEVQVDAEPDEDNPVEPLLIPGRRAVHQFGRTLKFCPYLLRESRLLQIGDTAHCAVYKGQKYLFSSRNAMDAFITNPIRYMPSVPPSLPAPRLWILGVPSAGKHTLAKTLCAAYSVPLFPFSSGAFTAMTQAGAGQGGSVEGTFIPSQPTNPQLLQAIRIQSDLAAFEERQKQQTALKEKTQEQQAERERLREEGEEVDELDEDEEAEIARILEFEPEEEEAKTEREGKALRQIAAALTRIEPFETQGYILIEHPVNEIECQQLIDAGAIPEAVVHIKLSVELFVARRLDSEMRTKEAEFAAQLADVKAKKTEFATQQRRIELMRWRRRNIGGDDEPVPDPEEPPEDPEPVSQEAVRGNLESLYDNEIANVGNVLALFAEKRIPVTELNGDSGQDAVMSACCESLSANLSRRRSLFEAPQIVSYDEAIRLLQNGTKVASSFGFTDSVQLATERAGVPPTYLHKAPATSIEPEPLEPEPEAPQPKPKLKRVVTKQNDEGEDVEVEEEYEEEEPEPEAEEDEPEPEPEPEASPEELEEMLKELNEQRKKAADAAKPRAAILRNRLYFFDSQANLLQFMRNPLKFWDQPPPLEPVPSVVAVFETLESDLLPDGVRPRNLAHHLAANLRYQYVDVPKLVKWSLARRDVLPSLYEGFKERLLDQETPLPNDLVASALCCRLQAADVQSSGAVLFDLPRNYKQFMSLTASEFVLNVALRANNYIEEDVRLFTMINGVARTLHPLHGDTKELATLVEACEVVRQNTTQRQNLQLRRKLGFPARIGNASVTEAQLEHSLSVFQWYCPYKWARENQLVSCNDSRSYAAEYCGETYFFSEEAYLQEFLANPQRFSGETPPPLRPLPTMLPQLVETPVGREQLEFCGCCPVTLFETRSHKGLRGITEPTAVLGQDTLTVEYGGKYYSLVDDRALTLFLRQPWVYAEGATLPLAQQLPFEHKQWVQLSGEQYITRALYEEVAGALLAVVETRPKFPGLSLEESALKFVALHLKSKNKLNTEFRSRCYRDNLCAFEERATLYKTVTTVAPEDPEELAKFEHRCRVWDDVQDDKECYKGYASLPATEAEPAATAMSTH